MQTESESKSKSKSKSKGILTSKEKIKYSVVLSLIVGLATFLNKVLTKDVGAALAHSLVIFIFTIPFSYLVVMYFSKKAKNEIEKTINDIDTSQQATSENIGKNGFTRLMAAAVNVDLEDIKNFVNDGDDVNAIDTKGYTALMYAASNERLASVQLLLMLGADKSIRTAKGNDAFYFADIKNHLEVKKLLKI